MPLRGKPLKHPDPAKILLAFRHAARRPDGPSPLWSKLHDTALTECWLYPCGVTTLVLPVVLSLKTSSLIFWLSRMFEYWATR